LHPYLQRLVYRDVLRRRLHQEGGNKEDIKERRTICLLHTRPHIVSVSPLESLVSLRKVGESTEASSAADLLLTRRIAPTLSGNLDVSRGEILFAKGVLLVEGDAEVYLVLPWPA